MATACWDTALEIDAPAGRLEARLSWRSGADPLVVVVVCPPHPLLAGNLDNNVVRAVAAGALDADAACLRFNYRAVGNSGHPEPDLPRFEYWQRIDARGACTEVVADVNAVVKHMAGWFARVHLVGYSFGGRLALRARGRWATRWCAIATPWQPEDLALLSEAATTGLVVNAERDDLLESASAMQLPSALHCDVVSGADHFFRGQEDEVRTRVAQFFRNDRESNP